METIFNNYINWLKSKSEQYEEYERDEERKSIYFKKYTEIPGVFKFCLYMSIPVIGWIYGIKKTEKGGKYEGIIGVLFDDDGKVVGVTKKEDEKLLKDLYNKKTFTEMMMKQPKEKCPKCQKEVDLNEKICPFCGFNIKRFKIIFVIIIFPIGILLIYNLFNWFSSPQIPQNLPQEPCSTEMKQIAESYYGPRIKVEFISCIHDINQKKFFGSTRQEQNGLPIITQFNCNDKAAIFSESYYLSEEYKGEYEVGIGCDIF